MQTVQGHALAETGPKRDACHSGGMVRGGRRAAHRQQMCALLVAAVAISIDPTTRSQPAAAFQPNIRHNRRRSGRSGSGGRMHAPRTRTVAALVPTCYHVCCQRLIAAHGTGALEAPGRHQPRSKPEVGHAVAGHDGVCSGDGTGAVKRPVDGGSGFFSRPLAVVMCVQCAPDIILAYVSQWRWSGRSGSGRWTAAPSASGESWRPPSRR